MAKEKSLGKNAVLNVIRTILALIAPLITFPYVYRILGAEKLGSVNYTYSIIQYFVLFSGLGISTYGIREGARIRNKQLEINSFISECFSINTIFTIISYLGIIALLLVLGSKNDYFALFVVQSFLVFFNTIGIEWVNNVFEDFYYITVRTVIVQLLNIALTFLLIHEQDDYIIYAAVSVSTNAFVSILNWFHYKKKTTIRLTRKINFSKHMKPIFVFFANKLAVTIYVSADTTMLGAMVSNYSVGIYSASVKIYTILKNLLAAIYTVFLPRLAFIDGNQNDEEFKKLYSDLFSLMSLLIIPTSIGLWVLSENIILILFGTEYLDAKGPLCVLSIAIVFSIYGGLVSAVYDVVKGLEKIALHATILSASINVLANWIILPHYKELGAAFTTLLAELMVFLFCIFKSKGISKYIEKKVVFRNIAHALLGSFEVFTIVCFFTEMVNNDILVCTLSFVTSVLVYAASLLIIKNPYAIKYAKFLRDRFKVLI